jgi:hypothetical protein
VQGIQGIQGIQGPQGLPGDTGPQGPAGISGFGSYGSFYDTVTQTNPVTNQANAMLFRNAGDADGVSIVNNSEITFANAGVYNVAFSVQIAKTNGSSEDIWIWLRQNGNNLDWTNTGLTIQGNTQKLVAAWNFFVTVNAGDNVQLMWHSVDASMTLLAATPVAANGNPALPGTPSTILTVNQVQ